MLAVKFKNHKIILGSKSPRRSKLLARLDLDFDVVPLNVDESYAEGLKRHEITEYLCHKKRAAYQKWQPNHILITSDTIVWQNERAYEKPKNAEDAKDMLKHLSDNTHEVITSIGIFSPEKEKILTDVTEVSFGKLEPEEIAYYVEKYKPYDKAGAYGIQEWIGYIGIREIKGSYFNVMGLPVYKLYHALKEF